MKRLYTMALASAMCITSASAQETYESAAIATQDLNGTARYIGMGGALEALGSDISTTGTNPAGIGLFRRSWVGMSLGTSSNYSLSGGASDGKTTFGLDQLGFVYSMRANEKSRVNFAVNYHKSRNFNQILSATNALKGGSQNKLTHAKARRGSQDNGGFSADFNKDNEIIGYEDSHSDYTSRCFSQNDYMNINALNYDSETNDLYYAEANGFNYYHDQEGYVAAYDFTISGNVNDRFYWGLTLGVEDVNYYNSSQYREFLVDSNDMPIGFVDVCDNRDIKGSGVNLKGGVIFRPIEADPLRIGLSIATPTWYTLTSSNYTELSNRSDFGLYDNGRSNDAYDYKLFTPWKFGASVGTTIGTSLALGLSYDYADYSLTSNRYIYDSYYDYYMDEPATRSKKDIPMNNHTKASLNGVHTVKVGFEGKVADGFSLRAGYNYVSPMYKKTAQRDGTVASDGTYFSSTTAFTNWKATNRITAGIGYSTKSFNIDLAYQYATQDGVFYPFMELDDNKTVGTEITDDRHNVTLSVGFRF